MYDDGSNFAYTYDAVGNRLTETIGEATNQYTYDAANRLASVNGQAHTWDNNGNLLSDGVQTYTYNYANRLTQVVRGSDTYQYQYNGLGDRVQTILNSTAITYSLDLNNGLTQVLADGTNTYTYGFNRIAQVSETQTGYFLGDALGSVRQVVDPQAEILLAQSFSPYGVELSRVGDYETAYSYTGEMTDGTGMVNLRARYYDPGTGRFVSRDTWNGDHNNPITMNKWLYANGNPIIYVDPTGFYFWDLGYALLKSAEHRAQGQNIHIEIQKLAMVGQETIIHAEYPIPPTRLHVDLLDSNTGEVWEIKPWADKDAAFAELNIRLESLWLAKNANLLKGIDAIGMPYDWTIDPPFWVEGYSFSPEVYIGTDDTGLHHIFAGQIVPGVIVWWKYNTRTPEFVPVPIYLPEEMKYSKRNERSGWTPNGIPALNPQTAFIQIQNEEVVNDILPMTLFFIILINALQFIVCPPLTLAPP